LDEELQAHIRGGVDADAFSFGLGVFASPARPIIHAFAECFADDVRGVLD
jgi:hypothetical protein